MANLRINWDDVKRMDLVLCSVPVVNKTFKHQQKEYFLLEKKKLPLHLRNNPNLKILKGRMSSGMFMLDHTDTISFIYSKHLRATATVTIPFYISYISKRRRGHLHKLL